MNIRILAAALLSTTAIAACATSTDHEQGAQEGDLVAAADAGADRSTGDAQASHYLGGYECDPLKNLGCPDGEACLLAYDKDKGEEVVKCKSKSSEKFCGYSFDWDHSHFEIDGRFIAAECVGGEASGVPLAACLPLNAQGIPYVPCPLASQQCKYNDNGIYGFCDRSFSAQ